MFSRIAGELVVTGRRPVAVDTRRPVCHDPLPMGRKYRFQSTINAPRELMISMLTSQEFLETEARENGAVEVEVRIRKRGKNKLSLTITKADPARDDEGNVVEGKLDHIVYEQEWDLKKGEVEWTHTMKELEGVEVKGRNRILEDGPKSCKLVEEGEISLNSGMPWFGWLIDWWIAGRVITGMKTERARRAVYLAKKARDEKKN
jgi:hypothetical protein